MTSAATAWRGGGNERATRLICEAETDPHSGDGGGSNSASHYVFRERPASWAQPNRLGLEDSNGPLSAVLFQAQADSNIGCLLCHAQPAKGSILHMLEIALHFIERTKTTTGLGVYAMDSGTKCMKQGANTLADLQIQDGNCF